MTPHHLVELYVWSPRGRFEVALSPSLRAYVELVPGGGVRVFDVYDGDIHIDKTDPADAFGDGSEPLQKGAVVSFWRYWEPGEPMGTVEIFDELVSNYGEISRHVLDCKVTSTFEPAPGEYEDIEYTTSLFVRGS